MTTITLDDFRKMSVDLDSLPPMVTRKGDGKRTRMDRKRGADAKRETLARRQARVLSGKAV